MTGKAYAERHHWQVQSVWNILTNRCFYAILRTMFINQYPAKASHLKQGKQGVQPRRATGLRNTRLISLRESLGLTQGAFAARLGMSMSAYCNYEMMRHYPCSRHAELLAEAAGCGVEELFPKYLRVIETESETDADHEVESERQPTVMPRASAPAPAATELTPEDFLASEEFLACVKGALSERQYDVTIRFFGLAGRPAETIDAIGASQDVTGTYIREIVRRALKKLRRAFLRAGLAPAWHQPWTSRPIADVVEDDQA